MEEFLQEEAEGVDSQEEEPQVEVFQEDSQEDLEEEDQVALNHLGGPVAGAPPPQNDKPVGWPLEVYNGDKKTEEFLAS